MLEESLPCNLELRIDAGDVPANRAALKLLSLLEGLSSDEPQMTRIAEIADLIKSEYFRLSEPRCAFCRRVSTSNTSISARMTNLTPERLRLKNRYRIGFWDADALENAFAYVGSDLRVSAWLSARTSCSPTCPARYATKEMLNIDPGAQDRDPDIADNVENAETAKLEEKGVERKRRPSRDVHPAALAWTALVVQRFAELLHAVPREGKPAELRAELMGLLDRLGFRDQIAEPARSRRREATAAGDAQLQRARSVASRIRRGDQEHRARLPAVRRHAALELSIRKCAARLVRSRSSLARADRNGLRVLEATDVRGLRFRAVFIAGLIEGGFPLSASRDWIYPHEERDRLREYGLTLEDISPNTLLKEEHYFYQVACRATERLYLTRPLLLGDDSETVASYYIDELRRADCAIQARNRDYPSRLRRQAARTTLQPRPR